MKSPPTVLIIGEVGQVGWELRRVLGPLGRLVSVDFPKIDLSDGNSIRHWVRNVRPDIIINAAAYTAVDKAETETELCHLINGVAPGILAEESEALGSVLVHYSTDYVFDGTKQTPYTEEDPPNPLSAYGRSKLAGDQAILQVGGNHLIFRLCWVYGARGQNFMLTIMRLARDREKLRIVADQFGCPTWSRMIAQTTALALSRILADPDSTRFKGTYNLAASGQTNWHGFARAIVDLVPAGERKCNIVEPITTPEYPLPARRPAFSVLNCDKLARTFGLRLPDWKESLNLVLESVVKT